MDNNTAPTPPMPFKEACLKCFNQYADFKGRAKRAEFWWFYLLNLCIGIVLGILAEFVDFFGLLSTAYVLAVLVPALAVSWRRLHDIGRAGGWYFISLIPIVGTIIVLIWFAKESEPQDNRFAPTWLNLGLETIMQPDAPRVRLRFV